MSACFYVVPSRQLCVCLIYSDVCAQAFATICHPVHGDIWGSHHMSFSLSFPLSLSYFCSLRQIWIWVSRLYLVIVNIDLRTVAQPFYSINLYMICTNTTINIHHGSWWIMSSGVMALIPYVQYWQMQASKEEIHPHTSTVILSCQCVSCSKQSFF